MMNNLSKLGLSLMAALWLSGCSTLGGVGDAISSINPFDNSDATEIGDNGDQTDRISILELDETLKLTGTITPDQVQLPPAYVNTDWPQVGGNPAHVVQHTAATGNLDKIWSKNVGKGSARKGRVVCLLYTSPSPRDGLLSRMPSSA